jgi:hypothetical protein
MMCLLSSNAGSLVLADKGNAHRTRRVQLRPKKGRFLGTGRALRLTRRQTWMGVRRPPIILMMIGMPQQQPLA